MERVAFQYKVYGNFLEIIPDESIQDNSVYEIRIKKIKSIDGIKSIDNLKFQVTTKMTPAYCTVEAVSVLVDVFKIPEENIMYYIREASKHADYINGSSVVSGDGTASFEVQQFVKIKATIDALLKAYLNKASISGDKGQVGNVLFENGSKLDGLKDLLDALKGDLKKWEDAILGYKNEGRAKPVTVVKSSKATTSTNIDSILADFTRGFSESV